jgi:hypothetical protein
VNPLPAAHSIHLFLGPVKITPCKSVVIWSRIYYIFPRKPTTPPRNLTRYYQKYYGYRGFRSNKRSLKKERGAHTAKNTEKTEEQFEQQQRSCKCSVAYNGNIYVVTGYRNIPIEFI